MRLLPRYALMLALTAAAPAFAQVRTASATTPPMPPTPAATAAVPADASNPSINYAALREDVARQNKTLTDQVAAQRNIVKKNQDLLKEAQKLQVANLKLADEKKKLEAESAELEKQRMALKSAQKPEVN